MNGYMPCANPVVQTGRILGPTRCHEIIDSLSDKSRTSRSKREISKTLHNAFRLYSEWSAEHSIRVGVCVTRFSRVLGHAEDDAAGFGLAACLHDIGKLSVPVQLLNKNSALSREERAVVADHVTTGGQCFNGLDYTDDELTRDLIRHHHENFDGSGYPDGLSGAEVSEVVQIAKICDFFDACHFDRPYRKGLSIADTVALMDKNAHMFNPTLLKTFKSDLHHIRIATEDLTETAPAGTRTPVPSNDTVIADMH